MSREAPVNRDRLNAFRATYAGTRIEIDANGVYAFDPETGELLATLIPEESAHAA